MIKEYLKALEELFNKMSSRGGDFTVWDYFSTIIMTLGLMLVIAGIIMLVIGLFLGPVKMYKMLLAPLYAERNNLYAEENPSIEKKMALDKKIRRRIFMLVCGIVMVYIPIAIPTAMYLCYLVFHI